MTNFVGNGIPGFIDGQGILAQFTYPSHITVDFQDNLYIADENRIRKVTPDGLVTTFPGEFRCPRGLIVDRLGSIYFADGECIREISPTGEVYVLAGNSSQGDHVDGLGSEARFSTPFGICLGDGCLYVLEWKRSYVRKIV